MVFTGKRLKRVRACSGSVQVCAALSNVSHAATHRYEATRGEHLACYLALVMKGRGSAPM